MTCAQICRSARRWEIERTDQHPCSIRMQGEVGALNVDGFHGMIKAAVPVRRTGHGVLREPHFRQREQEGQR